ncbi:MAG: methionyl-tRNA formyltransferase [Candidatus Yanofskybacteria bacterium RIFCSPHIGHO2_02_FULL_41_29]|uniref:Methionyl-tRNA formyltransferase n=1 Tax=Candidatus Yanofskybacteria bacterium RIFCSPHIGHO2_01_FULL_41_53 TaxID=1802663 RepID=A0A1F8EKJ3_9BACT|nr:MAG: methionyl-tRNA formyltransferase [Candidatus Yanofskybacteria bacterium RIFCSPHIGHO2_01_FULL_41_53]OGN11826.1 MAG: methionyl-tRNA formyltransferase [Candidatus Yanofskybacteria bacterium RIFCSPHIGHO2_02_FULL_41_29]OGN17268.1 MAG: methionyl-tRNA formyltransferase [Candidatus Yanofskybacteria bacterium RIFCSPHIGHO2_12_FULL_41_9]OGN23074.1 MAG: methionyl-tRNA formyltransferase [Candidatus Yanofskybacteria bacterium RIFCSPLOWO2_01_FULL_41_67]OGN29877.1 MAG: methionyl-tRNA formyltransferase 
MSDNLLKIVFFGTSSFAVPALRYLVQNGYNLVAVVTQPDRPTGRQRVTMPSPVKKVTVELNIPVLEFHNLKEEDSFKKFKHLNPDICIVAAYGKIIPSQYLEVPKHGFLNIHPSLLPKYRGPSPIQNALLNGDKETGVAILKVDEEVDHGPVLKATSYKLEATSYYKEVEQELAELGGKLLLETLPKYINGEIKPKEQNHAEATFTKKMEQHDGKIDWNKTAEKIYNQIRALNPEPGTWTSWNNQIINIKSAVLSDRSAKETPGTVVKLDNSIAVASKTCYLVLKQTQLEGGKAMDPKAFINGHPELIGSKLE